MISRRVATAWPLAAVLAVVVGRGAPVALAGDHPYSQAGEIIEAIEAPTLGHAWYTFRYTIQTACQIITATEMVHPSARPEKSQSAVGILSKVLPVYRVPPKLQTPEMSFRVGQRVRFSIQQGPLAPNRLRELYVQDRKGKEHILSVNETLPKTAPASGYRGTH